MSPATALPSGFDVASGVVIAVSTVRSPASAVPATPPAKATARPASSILRLMRIPAPSPVSAQAGDGFGQAALERPLRPHPILPLAAALLGAAQWGWHADLSEFCP